MRHAVLAVRVEHQSLMDWAGNAVLVECSRISLSDPPDSYKSKPWEERPKRPGREHCHSSIGDPPEFARRPLVLPDILLDRPLLRGIEPLKFRHVGTSRGRVLSRDAPAREKNCKNDCESHPL